jgi:hypothetical protein
MSKRVQICVVGSLLSLVLGTAIAQAPSSAAPNSRAECAPPAGFDQASKKAGPPKSTSASRPPVPSTVQQIVYCTPGQSGVSTTSESASPTEQIHGSVKVSGLEVSKSGGELAKDSFVATSTEIRAGPFLLKMGGVNQWILLAIALLALGVAAFHLYLIVSKPSEARTGSGSTLVLVGGAGLVLLFMFVFMMRSPESGSTEHLKIVAEEFRTVVRDGCTPLMHTNEVLRREVDELGRSLFAAQTELKLSRSAATLDPWMSAAIGLMMGMLLVSTGYLPRLRGWFATATDAGMDDLLRVLRENERENIAEIVKEIRRRKGDRDNPRATSS